MEVRQVALRKKREAVSMAKKKKDRGNEHLALAVSAVCHHRASWRIPPHIGCHLSLINNYLSNQEEEKSMYYN